MQLILAAMFALALAIGVDETKLGAGVTLDEATPIASIVKAPADYVGKTVRVDGVATAGCEMMGCWLAVSESDAKDAPTVRLKVEHEGAIVFPMSAKGKKVSAQGVFEIAAAEMEHEHAGGTPVKHEPMTADKYQVTRDGWSVASTADLTAQTAPMSYSEAEEALTTMRQQQPGKARALTILRKSELSLA